MLYEVITLYICENNQWQAFVHRREAMSRERVADWGAGYGIPVRNVDGNDVFAVLEATREAASQVRDTSRPALLEVMTYRTRGHFEPDDQGYVDKAELATWLARDPIALCRDRLIASENHTPAADAELANRVDARIAAAVAFAAASPFPSIEELTLDVYA